MSRGCQRAPAADPARPSHYCAVSEAVENEGPITVTPRAIEMGNQKLPEAAARTSGFGWAEGRAGARGSATTSSSPTRSRDGRDLVMDLDGLRLLVDKRSVKYLKGSVLDWNGGLEYGFRWKPPRTRTAPTCEPSNRSDGTVGGVGLRTSDEPEAVLISFLDGPTMPSRFQNRASMGPIIPSRFKDRSSMGPTMPSRFQNRASMGPTLPSRFRKSSSMGPTMPSRFQNRSSMGPTLPRRFQNRSRWVPPCRGDFKIDLDGPTMVPTGRTWTPAPGSTWLPRVRDRGRPPQDRLRPSCRRFRRRKRARLASRTFLCRAAATRHTATLPRRRSGCILTTPITAVTAS